MVYLNDLYSHYFKCILSFRLPYLSKLNLNESILLSWPFVILNAFYTLMIYVVFNKSILGSTSIILLFSWLAIGTILFPLFSYLFYFFWKLSLSFYFGAMDVESYKADRIISTSFSSYTLLGIPFIGNILQRIFQFYLLYKNIKFELGISPFKTGLVVMTPLILQMFLFFAFLLSFISIIYMIFKF